jgi:energy-coupling factor transport system permease protein
MTFTPHLVADVQRLRAARRLRGRSDRGLRAVLSVGLPVLEGALERSIGLAAAMDTRGFGRTAEVPAPVARATAGLTVGGLLGLCTAAYGLLTPGAAGWAVPVLLLGLAGTAGGLALGGRRTARSRYRADPWALPEWLVAGSGLAVAALTGWLAERLPAAFNPSVVPPVAPELPLAAVAVLLLGLLPAVAAPVPPRSTA